MRFRVCAFLLYLSSALLCSAGDFPKWTARNGVSIGDSPAAIVYSPDGKLLAVGDTDGTLKIVSVDEAAVVKTLSSGLNPVREIRFLSRTQRLLTCGGANKFVVFSTSDWAVVAQGEGIRACNVSSDEKQLVGGDGKQNKEALVLWDSAELKQVRELFSNGARPVNPAFVHGDRVAVAVSRVPYLIDVNTGKPAKIQEPGDNSTKVRFEQTRDNQIAISLGTLQDDDAPTHRISASRDGFLIALGRGWFGQPDFVDIFHAADMKRLARIKEENTGTDSSISFDNQLVAVGSSKPGSVTIYRIRDKKKTAIACKGLFEFHPSKLELAVFNDGTLTFYTPTR